MNFKKILYLLLILFSFSCSKDDSTTPAPIAPKTFNDLVITTIQPTLESNNLSFNSGGNLSFVDYSFVVGVCYNKTGTPTISDDVFSLGSSSSQNYFVNINNIELGTTYYVRAFAQNNSTGEVKYGNQLSIVIPSSITTSIVKNISITGFSVDVNVASNLSNNTERGICYSTSQNPTVSNSHSSDSTTGAGNFTVSLDGINFSPTYYVSPNTTYYLRSYVEISGEYYYGNQVSFKTAGYIGGSGGYVFYDKGETTNGWRYLEAAPQYLTYNGNSSFRWISTSCTQNTFLNGIGTQIGTGLENSQVISNFCNYTSVGATMSMSTSLNGQTNWFLPSLDDLKEMYKLKVTNLTNLNSNNYTLLSSSQSSNSLCFILNTSNGSVTTTDKINYNTAWQVRRF